MSKRAPLSAAKIAPALAFIKGNSVTNNQLALQAAEKMTCSVILSEAKNLSSI
jgi:hypothetical protein